MATVRGARRTFSLPMVVVMFGLLVTAALFFTSRALYRSNEQRLLNLRVREASLVVAGAVPNTQTPLASATALANATGASPAKFRAFVRSYVGAPPAHRFVSISLWRLSNLARGPLVVVGQAPATAGIVPFLRHAASTSTLSLRDLLARPRPILGYAYAARASSHYIAYAESMLRSQRMSRIAADAAFSDLDYALYLGRGERRRNLLLADVSSLPLRGTVARASVPFGDSALTLVMAPRRSLSGGLPQLLPAIVVVAGVLLTLVAAGLTLRLLQRRRDAEAMAARLELSAAEVERLYGEQRNIAQTLQHALLPETLPAVSGLEVSARYKAGERGLEIGGDWYDLIELGARHLLLVVGDVSGRGLRAATTMAALRFAMRAYAVQGDHPAKILTKLSTLLNVAEGGQLATVLCAQVDVDAHEVTLTSAGHLPPLILTPGGASYAETAVGLPVGVETGTAYRSVTVTLAPSATLLAFTDGLIERRGESLDQGLERLRASVSSIHAALPDLLARVLHEMHHEGPEDDTAVVGLRWPA
ncbi:MAG: PP2C family protein-serine/threonine phosphatase [Solirubrobacteraceae bacterium]